MAFHYLVLAGFIVFMALVPFHTAGQQYVDDSCCTTQESIESIKTTGKDRYLNIVIAATLNGAITAIDGDTGDLLWKYDDEPLLQGTLSSAGVIEVGGTSVQLMPTLDGRLFSYAHKTNLIEPLPITTESLLESTVRLGRDAVAGGKSVSTTGIDVLTGEIYYKCTPESCDNSENAGYSQNPTLLIKRISNTIRAMDSLRGTERWNLSTAELDLSLAELGVGDIRIPKSKFLLRPPDGVITATNRFGNEKWTVNVDGHIVNVWHVFGNSISEVSLFDPANIFTTQNEVGHRGSRNLPAQSSLFYMGTSNGYPFIIQSSKAKENLKKKLKDMTSVDIIRELSQPMLCSASNAAQGLSYEIEDNTLMLLLHRAFQTSHSKMIESKTNTNTGNRQSLVIVSHGEEEENSWKRCINPRSSGVALIGSENLRSTSMYNEGDYGYLVLDSQSCKQSLSSAPIPVQVIINFSHYLKYMFGFMASSLLGAYYTFTRLKKRSIHGNEEDSSQSTVSTSTSSANSRCDAICLMPPSPKVKEISDEMKLEMFNSPQRKVQRSASDRKGSSQSFSSSIEKSRKSFSASKRSRSFKIRTNSIGDELSSIEARRSLEKLKSFESKFEKDFIVETIIGSGGFGVVFKAKSRLDNNDYAVKRIAVANTERARERVKREAQTMAVFDHPGIIRYFHAWEEQPPNGWQKLKDKSLLERIKKEQKIKMLAKKFEEKKMLLHSEDKSNLESIEIPSMVGNTETSNSDILKPIGVRRGTTTESKRGLAGKEVTSASIGFPSIEAASLSAQSSKINDSSSDESSSSDSEISAGEIEDDVFSSSGGIEFYDENQKETNKLERIEESEMLVETENNEIEVIKNENPGSCVYLYIVMQLCDVKTLADWISKNKTKESRPLNMMKNWIKQLAEALSYLHDNGFIHRDLKPGNVFFALDNKKKGITTYRTLKLGDLGLATNTVGNHSVKKLKESGNEAIHTKNVGTRSYMSPEQLANQRYSKKIDIFALGLVATELIIPFDTTMERLNVFWDLQAGRHPKIFDDYPEASEFLLLLTSMNPADRPNADEVLAHPFITDCK